MPYDGKITDFAQDLKPFDFDTASPDQRLLELARHLEDEQAWRDSKMEWNFDVTYEANEDAYIHCGTAGCALGLARTVWPQWMKLWHDDGYLNGDFAAAKTAFNLANSDTDILFTVVGYDLPNWADPEPKNVAERIRDFVAKRTGGVGNG